jgi:hypothetical protein
LTRREKFGRVTEERKKERKKMNKFAMEINIEEKFRTEQFVTSDCCGEYLNDEQIIYGLCPRCLEHCEISVEFIPIV